MVFIFYDTIITSDPLELNLIPSNYAINERNNWDQIPSIYC